MTKTPIKRLRDPDSGAITALRIETDIPWIDQHPCAKCDTITFDPVLARGAKEPELYIVGEAPGREEAKLKQPFVGRSGKLLERVLDEIFQGQDKDRYVRIWNAVACRPENNRTPTKAELNLCSQYVRMDVWYRKPSVVLLVGRVPINAFFPDAPNKPMRAWIEQSPHDWEFNDRTLPVYCAYHPAYILRQSGVKAIDVTNDWKASIAAAVHAAIG